jgi:hypothetical protein
MGTERSDRSIEVADLERKVLPARWHEAVDVEEVHLLCADLQPRSGKAEVGSLDLGHPEHVGVEAAGRIHIGDVERDVMDSAEFD